MIKSKFSPNQQQKNWYIIDADQKTLGRLSTEIAKILMGKHKSIYAPYLECGDCVIVINVKTLKVSGKKPTQKIYYNHSGYTGGLRRERFLDLQNRFPEKILEHAIKGMLPKNVLGRRMFKNLKIYTDNYHPHNSQKPKLIEIVT